MMAINKSVRSGRISLLAAAVLLATPVRTVDDVRSADNDVGSRVFTSHPSSPSQLYINEAVGTTRVHTLANKNKLYELLLYPTKLAGHPLKAAAVLSGDIAGTVFLTQQKPPLGAVLIDGFVQDSRTTLHVQFDKYGDLSSGCNLDKLQPFNPYGSSHGRYNDPTRALGDLGEVLVTDNHFELSDRSVSLTGTRSVLGRSVILTDGQGRAGCGVVGYA